MKILFIGDSITNGKLGVSYVQMIANKNPQWKITNLGNDGETYNIIMDRLLIHLKSVNDYEYLILQGGYNDLLLPTFKNKGSLFNFAYNHQLNLGMVSLIDSKDTSFFLHDSIRKIKEIFKGKIIILTVGCVGENLTSLLNRQRNEFNNTVKKLVIEDELTLVDIGKEFEHYLEDKKQSDYCLDSFWAVTLLDKLRFKSINLSAKRKLYLTIDGVHLNKAGAEVIANCILKVLPLN